MKDMQVLIDTNIIVDTIQERQPYSSNSKQILALCIANKINGCDQGTIEIDTASHNGVDNVREIIEDAQERSLTSQYKIFVIDEVHMITTAGWNAFLKCLEEPPAFTIFIFCTTNPEKIPETIKNRFAMRFDLTKVNTNEIESRLKYICEQEQFENFDESINYIAKVAKGSARDAISMLEKCATLSNDLNIENVMNCLGLLSYDDMFDITNSLIDCDENTLINKLETIYNEGTNMSLFIDNYLSFVLDLTKYCIFKSLDVISIPSHFEEKIIYSTNIENSANYFKWLSEKILDIKNNIKQINNIKETIEVMMLSILRVD